MRFRARYTSLWNFPLLWGRDILMLSENYIRFFCHWQRSFRSPSRVRVLFYHNKKRRQNRRFVAGVEGLEPSRTVLETVMLPLHHTPIDKSNVLNYKRKDEYRQCFYL